MAPTRARPMPRRDRVRLIVFSLIPLLALGLAVVAGLVAQRRGQARAAWLPPSMPSHLGFGVMNAPGAVGALNAMRTQNGTAWEYRYQYLAGGVNTGNGWETWNSPAGQFATNYLRESGNNGYVPALVYYEMAQSRGSCAACPESDRDLANLDNSHTMAAYYANWTLLMRAIGAYGKPALVIVEPDLWGYIEQVASQGNNTAAQVPASVASSGVADAAGLPDSAQGFAWALLHIRDRYAHNAILTLHASPWGTRVDIGSDKRGPAQLDVTALATQEAAFLRTCGLAGAPNGISTFDLLSSDLADHDSGQSGLWWDPTNRLFPNFARYLQFTRTLAIGTQRRVILWQVPAGNQYFDTENNTPGHTQDNRPEYIMGHLAAFADSGIAAVLFGPGNGGTMPIDARHDGVTNPAPIATFQCDRCDTHTSTYPDDDGGYLRIFVGQYYRHGALPLPLSLTSGSPMATPAGVRATATLAPTSPTATAAATGGTTGGTTSGTTGGTLPTASSATQRLQNAPCLIMVNGIQVRGTCSGSFAPAPGRR
ncbi:MAG TPA: hypothetical protein VIC85_15565 [Ktedonobacterales bacterium]